MSCEGKRGMSSEDNTHPRQVFIVSVETMTVASIMIRYMLRATWFLVSLSLPAIQDYEQPILCDVMTI